jgi:6-phosphogluconolactonase
MEFSVLITCSNANYLNHAENWWVSTALDFIDTQDRFTACLSGGNTPSRLYQKLVLNRQLRGRWNKVSLWFGDERCVPPDDPLSNYYMLKQSGLTEVPGVEIQRIEAELAPDSAASRYAQRLNTLPQFKGMPVFDLIMLGMGVDGHVASIFPASSTVQGQDKPVTACHVEDIGWRISIGMPVIVAARKILVLVTGQHKAELLASVLAGEAMHLPIGMVAKLPQVDWIVDEDAASRLKPV